MFYVRGQVLPSRILSTILANTFASMNVLGVAEILLLVTSFLGTYEAAIPLFTTCAMNTHILENLIDDYRLDFFIVILDASYSYDD